MLDVLGLIAWSIATVVAVLIALVGAVGSWGDLQRNALPAWKRTLIRATLIRHVGRLAIYLIAVGAVGAMYLDAFGLALLLTAAAILVLAVTSATDLYVGALLRRAGTESTRDA